MIERGTQWTPEQEGLAQQMWRAGVRVDRIGLEVGRTKAAVIGKADRRQWGLHPAGVGPRKREMA